VDNIARYDKVNPFGGSFRAALVGGGIWVAADIFKVWAVSLDTNGRIVKGTTGAAAAMGPVAAGVLVLHKLPNAGDFHDVMVHGEITEFTLQAGGAAGAATRYYGLASGDFNATVPGAGVNGLTIGHTVEATRLIVQARWIQG
jgi:hypothetical protein